MHPAQSRDQRRAVGKRALASLALGRGRQRVQSAQPLAQLDHALVKGQHLDGGAWHTQIVQRLLRTHSHLISELAKIATLSE